MTDNKKASRQEKLLADQHSHRFKSPVDLTALAPLLPGIPGKPVAGHHRAVSLCHSW